MINRLDFFFQKWKVSLWEYLPNLFLAILVFTFFYFLAKVVRKISLNSYSRIFKKQSDVAKIISAFVYFLTLLLGVFFALEILGLDDVLSKLLASAGIIGIIASFAFKDIASNTFAGFLLNLERPFKKGEWVEIGDHYGIVRKIGWITTSIKTVNGQEVFVPNQVIYNTTFTNYSTFRKRRVVLQTGVSYGDDLEFVREVTLDEVQKISAVLKKDPIDFYFTNIGSSAYNFEVRFWIRFNKQTDYLEAMNETIIRIKKRFEQENISIAYSVMTLDFGVKGGVNFFDKPINIQEKR